ncbi:fructosamine kinase family protein [Microlunatus aurantiacus]|uniref:Fructosamine kinase family protein n=1 Tax=Microlunatus aurantiacus TaxID=446786 RepID=A0ABP7DE76_9ACTN
MPDRFTKSRPAAPDAYLVEAAGLRWLAAAGPGSASVVEVLEVTPDQLVLPRLVPARPTRRAAAEFGTALATTHAAGAPAYGAPPDGWTGDGYIGTQPLSLRPTDRWGTFYAEQRLLPYADAATRIGNLSPRGRRLVERVADRLRAGELDDDRPPARIHGDLWAGNVIFTATGVTLIDPAAHGGHGLTDLAMLHLFGAPELGTISAAYAGAAGVGPGWQGLIGLHQLHPLLVHAVTHGAGYGAEAEAVAGRYA